MTPRPLTLWIEAVSWGFVALGLFLPFAFHTNAFASYREAVTRWAYDSALLPAADEKLLGLMLGITGGSIAGKWIVHALLARGPLRNGRAWARDLTLLGLAAWFVVDSVASLAIGAGFNVWMINLAPMALVGLPLVLAYRQFDDDRVATPSSATGNRGQLPVGANPDLAFHAASAARACFYASLLGASTGIAIAFGGNTPLFAAWFGGLEAAHYGGAAIAEPSRRLALFFFGPIGGCTLAQFVMLAGIARREPGTMRTAVAGAGSIVAWFAIDSGYGIANDGLFNIAMVNVPAALVTLPPWLVLAVWVHRRR